MKTSPSRSGAVLAVLVGTSMVHRRSDGSAREISNTTNVVIEDLTITNRTKADSALVRLDNCHGVRLGDIRIRGLAQGVEPIVAKNCTDVTIGPLTRSDE